MSSAGGQWNDLSQRLISGGALAVAGVMSPPTIENDTFRRIARLEADDARRLFDCPLDEVAGLVLQEFLLRVKNSGNVFTRHDRTRRQKGISIDGFEDVWTFFEPLKD